MKIKHLLILAGAFVFLSGTAQTADEIISKYIENTGGYANWSKVESMKMVGVMKQQGLDFPVEMIQLKDGRQSNSFNVQGKEFKQEVYDGTTLWSHNFANMKAEKSDAESTDNFKVNLASDFPIPFFDYKKRGYKIELLGKETVDGTEAFKVKLTKNQIKVDGVATDNIDYYFFDVENFVPILLEKEIKSGPNKGMNIQVKLSDYQDVNGLMVPFSLMQGAKGSPAQVPFVFTKVEINVKVEASVFALPAEN